MGKWVIFCLIIALALSACGRAQSGPTPTLPPFPTLPPPAPTAPLLVFATPTPHNTAALPTQRVTLPRTPAPSMLTPLAPGPQLAALAEIQRLGKGVLLDFAFSPDGQWLGLAVRRGIYLYAAGSLNLVRFIATPAETPRLAFAPDGSQLAAADRDSRVSLYETASGKLIRQLDSGALGLPMALAFYDGGRRLVVSSAGEVGVLWETETGKMPHRWITSGNAAMAVSADGAVLATSYWNSSIYLWTLADGHGSGRLWGAEEILALQMAPNGATLLAGYGDQTAVIWQLDGGKALHTLRGHSDRVVSVAVSPDSRLAATGSWDNTVCLWDMASGALLRTLRGHTGRILQIGFSADSRRLASYAEDGRFQFWEVSTGQAGPQLDDFMLPGSIAFGADGETIYSGAQDGWLRAWNAQGEVQQARLAHPTGISALAISPTGQRLATAGPDGAIRLWETPDLRLTAEFTGAPGWVNCLVFSPNGRWLAAGGAGEVLRLWDLQTAQPAQELSTGEDQLLSLAFSPDGQSLAVGALSGSVTLWRSGESQPARVLRESGSFAGALSFAPDGQSLAYGGGDPVIALWRLSGSSLVLTQPGPTRAGLAALAYTPDGRLLIAAFWDHTLRCYNPTSGALLHSFELPFTARQLTLAQDGRRLALALDDGTFSLWGIR